MDKSGPGVVFQFSVCFQRAEPGEQIPFSLPPSYQGTEIIVGIPDADTRAVACKWITKVGLNVHEVESWEQILLYMRAVNWGSTTKRSGSFGNLISDSSDDLQRLSSGSEHSTIISVSQERTSSSHEFWRSWKDSDERPGSGQMRQLMVLDTSLLPSDVRAEHLEEYLQESGFLMSRHLDGLGVGSKSDVNDRDRRELQGDLSVMWVCASSIHEPIKVALRAVRNSFLVKRPLHPARLKEIFHLVSRDGEVVPYLDVRPPELLTSNIINYAKQQEWNNPYACDDDVSVAQGASPRATPPAMVQGRNVRYRPTATRSVPLEEISYSEMETRPSARAQKDDSSATSTKFMKRSVPVLAPVNGRTSFSGGFKPLTKLQILVAEDTPLLRKLAVTMLKRLGALTFEASNGQEALEAVLGRMRNDQAPFNCILMDCQVGFLTILYKHCQVAQLMD